MFHYASIFHAPAPIRAARILVKARKALEPRDVVYSGKAFRLLTPGNPKTEKGRGAGFVTFILHLAPARLSGFEVCPKRTAGCTIACLNTAGRGGIMAGVSGLTHDMVAAGMQNAVQKARIRRTRLFFLDRDEFMRRMVADVEKALMWTKRDGFTLVMRPNGTSDIRWETVPCWRNGKRYASIMLAFPEIQFYDYTKIANRRNLPANYHLTFSLAEGNDSDAARALANGMNIAAVFRNKETVARYIDTGFALNTAPQPVFCGDDSDLRFLDPRQHIIALYAKGNAKRDASGFVRD